MTERLTLVPDRWSNEGAEKERQRRRLDPLVVEMEQLAKRLDDEARAQRFGGRPEHGREQMHDANGKVLAVGDEVFIPAKVERIDAGEEYCNAYVTTTLLMPPYTDPNMGKTGVTLNTRQLVKTDASTAGGQHHLVSVPTLAAVPAQAPAE